uniref:DUF834 domain-containing protein n=1 Tax=Oryza glumipatula TaxID=40148 RepID=A0A0E0AY40_9ORYZ
MLASLIIFTLLLHPSSLSLSPPFFFFSSHLRRPNPCGGGGVVEPPPRRREGGGKEGGRPSGIAGVAWVAEALWSPRSGDGKAAAREAIGRRELGDGKGAAREAVGRRERSGWRRPAAMTAWWRNGTLNGGTIEEMADGERNGGPMRGAHDWQGNLVAIFGQ